MRTPFIPDAGDLIWMNFDPQAGREQAGRRPAVVLSPASYNRKSELALVCPVTTKSKGYPFEVPLPEGSPISGVVLADQVKSIDWANRRAERIGQVSPDVLDEILGRIRPLFGF